MGDKDLRRSEVEVSSLIFEPKHLIAHSLHKISVTKHEVKTYVN